MRIVFMGTPAFGVPTLRHLVVAGYSVVGVVTQPDRPAGRGSQPQSSAVKQAAVELGVPVLQPERLRDPTALHDLKAMTPDLMVVAAYGQILPSALLALPRFGAINVHASLLPKYRGAAPIAAAILAGDRETGVTIMSMSAGLDTGPILAQRREPIHDDDTADSLSQRLALLGATLLVEALPAWIGGQLLPRPQDEVAASYAPTLRREDGQVDWSSPAEEIARRCRAFFPWPGCFTHWGSRKLKLLAMHAVPEGPEHAQVLGLVSRGATGSVLLVATGRNVISLDTVQLEGRRPLAAAEFLRGQPGIIGAVLR